MDINNTKYKVLDEESTLGIYVWEMPDGRWIGDDDGNFLSVTSKKGNRSRIDALAREVRTFGIPDPMDIGNYKDEMKKMGGMK